MKYPLSIFWVGAIRIPSRGKRMFIVFDEAAAGIADPIWKATEGSLTDEKHGDDLDSVLEPLAESG